MHSWNWDDLRFVAVLAEVGTIAEAARRLNVNRTTVQRRISAFETQLSYRLFSRDGWGLKPLPEASPILEAAREIGDALIRIERKTTGAVQDISGELSLTMPDDLFLSGVSEVINAFQARYPALQVHLSITTRELNLDQREAEVAIRPSIAPPEHLVGRRVCDMTFHPFASDSYLSQSTARSIHEHKWLTMQDAFRNSPSEMWVADNVPPTCIGLRADSFVALAEAVRLGQGVAMMPSGYGDAIPGLSRVEGLAKDRVATSLWLLTHPDYRQSPRVRAIMDFLGEALATYKCRFDA